MLKRNWQNPSAPPLTAPMAQKGRRADPELAKNLYQIAGAAGFPPAAQAFLGETAGNPDHPSGPAYSFFKRPEWILALLVGDAVTLSGNRLPTLSYVLGMQDLVSADPHDFDPVCPRRADPALNEQIEDDIIRLSPTSSLERVARLLGAEP